MKHHASYRLALLALLGAAGCSQLIGLSDYDVDRKLDQPGEGGEGGTHVTSGGKTSTGGKTAIPKGGEGNAGEGVGGDTGTGGTSTPGMAGDTGTPGDAGAGGGGGTPIPEVVIPCDTVDCCNTAGGQVVTKELLDNLGFEDGPGWWGESSSGGYDLVTAESAKTINAHLGSYFVWLGGDTNETALMLTPTLDIPPETGWVVLTGWRRAIFDSAVDKTDFCSVSIYKEGDYSSPINDLFLWDNGLDDAGSWEKFTKTEAGIGYVGQALQLSLIAITDDTSDDATFYASNFYFDDLSFTANYCVEK